MGKEQNAVFSIYTSSTVGDDGYGSQGLSGVHFVIPTIFQHLFVRVPFESAMIFGIKFCIKRLSLNRSLKYEGVLNNIND